ncbi:hypothetical protein M5F03_03315 [Acinetobacter sp. ANC 5579]|uniref:hypothetical protein n=1 Tax=Acinetobacter amyesii TaxID=2942470 RepID=UPI0020BEA5BA|nr:hypothetical protein [Acinetobacter amyesii]MCL6234201.1 hypothetical protein [Acinetobacter amyesii]
MTKFNKTVAIVSTLSATVLLAACTSTPTKSLAIQKPNNQYEVTAVGKTSLAAKNNAIAAANSTCGKNATPVVVDEKQEYNGVLKGVVDEKTGQMIQAAAGVLGTITGNSGSISKDDDYQTVLTFSCRAN